jgi:hypothetical protein
MRTQTRKRITRPQIINSGDQVTMAVVLPELAFLPRCCPFPNCCAPFLPSVKNQNGAFLWYSSLLWTIPTPANGLGYSYNCHRWSIVAESHSEVEIRHGQQDDWTNFEVWPNTGDALNDDVSSEEIELYHQLYMRPVAVEYVNQTVLSRYQSNTVGQRVLEYLFPHQTLSLSVSSNLPERSMCIES